MRAPDAAFADPRLAALYDGLDADRRDLDAYLAIADELGAHRVVEIGCGTGSLAVLLAARGYDVVGVDPAAASLDMARAKPDAGRVEWLHGDATVLAGRGLDADLAVMTSNVAQVFVDDEDWSATLAATRTALRPGGWLVLETRRPEARDWQHWHVPPTEVQLSDGRRVVVRRTVTAVDLPLVTFESVTVVDGESLPSVSTLCFRSQDEVVADLRQHGFTIHEVREAPDRPGKELVLLASASSPSPGPQPRSGGSQGGP